MIDLHCHILPGLDDGASSLDESMEMAKAALQDGITAVVATPHLFRGGFSTDDLGVIEGKRRELNDALARSNVAVEIKSGAEVHISHNLISEIRAHRQSLALNGSGYMFIEFPSGHIYSGAKNLIFDLMSEGVIPIIAHPERNAVFACDPGLLYDLVQMGALAQGNGGSLTGLYGREAGQAITHFLRWNLIHFLASDAHNSTSMAPRLAEACKSAETAVGKEGARCLVQDNPLAVLEDREIPYCPQPVDPRKAKKSLSLRIPSFLRRSPKRP